MDVRETIDIAAPVAGVWVLLTEEAQVKRWNPDLVSDEAIDPGPLRPGLRSRMRFREGGRVVEMQSEITEVEPLKRLGLELRGGSLGANPMRIVYAVAPSGSGTRVSFDETWLPSGLVLRVLTPLISLIGRRTVRQTLRRLKAVAEAGPG